MLWILLVFFAHTTLYGHIMSEIASICGVLWTNPDVFFLTRRLWGGSRKLLCWSNVMYVCQQVLWGVPSLAAFEVSAATGFCTEVLLKNTSLHVSLSDRRM